MGKDEDRGPDRSQSFWQEQNALYLGFWVELKSLNIRLATENL